MKQTGKDTFSSRRTMQVGNDSYQIYDINVLESRFSVSRLPVSLKVLLENLLRNENGESVSSTQIEALAAWQAKSVQTDQIAFTPSRIVLQDFTGVPAIVDLAAMRDAMVSLGADPALINPLKPVDLVIDHSVQVDESASATSLDVNTRLEFQRNKERYQFLRWGQKAFDNFRVVPPGTGIVHQVNLEYLSTVVTAETDPKNDSQTLAYPDTLVGTDSHTTMVNGLAVLGWGVGGIEAEAAMLGQSLSMVLPEVIGFRLHGKLPAGTTATDLVLTVTEILRAKKVVGKFVEFFGDGLSHLPLADRATIGNMSPEFGATCSYFPIDEETLRYLALTGRPAKSVALVEAYARAQGLWRVNNAPSAEYTDILELDLSDVVTSIAGPKRPQDRVSLSDASEAFTTYLNSDTSVPARQSTTSADSISLNTAPVELDGELGLLSDGDVVIAAITSCTNTSNPAVMLAAGLLARNARKRGLTSKPWVKTSLAPGSQVVAGYLQDSGLMDDLQALGFYVVGYGCTTCIGNSGPLPEPVVDAINEGHLTVASVLSGNRNFEGRIHQDVRANYLASPPLVVAYALAGTMTKNLIDQPLGEDSNGQAVYLKDIWPDSAEVSEYIARYVTSDLFARSYTQVFEGTEQWKRLDTPDKDIYDWPESSYIRQPPYFADMPAKPAPLIQIERARCLAKLGNSITTDHISPAGAINSTSSAGKYLEEQGITPGNFNSLGSRRGNHEVMMRGTFANVRLRNKLAPGTEGSATTHFPSKEQLSIYDAAMRYQSENVPLVILAGREYGTGSSRDWAAKGVNLLGVRVVIAQSYERIHRSNLVGFGVLPLQFVDGQNADSLGFDGSEVFSFGAVDDEQSEIEVIAVREDESAQLVRFNTTVRIDTKTEWEYYRHGGILHYVVRKLAGLLES